MKNIFKVFVGVAVSAMFLTACNVDNLKSTYTPVQSSEVSFVQSVVTDTEIDAKITTYNVDISRSTANEAVTVKLDGSKCPEGIKCPASVTFNAGEYTAKVPIDISGMEVGKSYKGSISLADESQFNKNVAAKTASFEFAKAYTWISLGNGQFYDGLALQPSNDDLGIIKLEIVKADGFKRWRIMNPFPKDNCIAAWDESYWIGSPTTVWEFWADDDDLVYWSGEIMTGLCYADLGTKGYEIKYMYPTDYSSAHTAQAALNCFIEDNIVQFYVPQVIGDSGYWFNYGAKYLLIPGGSITDLEAYLLED